MFKYALLHHRGDKATERNVTQDRIASLFIVHEHSGPVYLGRNGVFLLKFSSPVSVSIAWKRKIRRLTYEDERHGRAIFK